LKCYTHFNYHGMYLILTEQNIFRLACCMSDHLTGDILTGSVHLSHFDYKKFKVLHIGSLTQYSLYR
jgi:hypothetical protein